MLTLSYLFAVVVADSVSGWLLYSAADDPLREVVERRFGTFPGTMYTIFLASAHGLSWSEILAPIETVNWWLPPVFFAYIVVMNLNALNIITALYVDAVAHVSNFDRTLQLSDTASREMKLIDGRLKPLFEAADRTKIGRISRAEMIRVLGKKDAAIALGDLGLDIMSMKALFKLVDAEERGSVSIDDFCTAMVHLKGNGPSVHIAMLLFQSRRLLVRLDKIGKCTESRLHVLKDLVESAMLEHASSKGSDLAMTLRKSWRG